jgi:CheY-like chemotaxis protein
MNQDYILIAEDDEDDQFLLSSAFTEIENSPHLVFVENGIELLDHFKRYDNGTLKKLPSLLIVDLNMPKKNGREALQELLTKDYFKKFPTVIFSTTANELEKSRCNALGVPNFFVKPSNYGSLLSIVSQFKQIAAPVKEI